MQGEQLDGALAYWYNQKNIRKVYKFDEMKGSYLGPSFSERYIKNTLQKFGADFIKVYKKDSYINLLLRIFRKENQLDGFKGRMEFGPRALGNRSILADPRNKSMQKNLNLKIKYRESFRPFAPSILFEEQSNWFDLNKPSPYMLLVGMIKKTKESFK